MPTRSRHTVADEMLPAGWRAGGQAGLGGLAGWLAGCLAGRGRLAREAGGRRALRAAQPGLHAGPLPRGCQLLHAVVMEEAFASWLQPSKEATVGADRHRRHQACGRQAGGGAGWGRQGSHHYVLAAAHQAA